jgi:hypothetical protein
LVVVSLLGSYEEALSADVDEDNTGHMTQNGLMGGGHRKWRFNLRGMGVRGGEAMWTGTWRESDQVDEW